MCWVSLPALAITFSLWRISVRNRQMMSAGRNEPVSTRQHPVAVQLLNPLTVQHVGLAPRHMLQALGIDQQHFKARRFQLLEHGYPHHPGGLHGHRLDLASFQPLDHSIQLWIKNPKLAHGALACGHTVSGHTDKVRRIAQIYPRSVRMHRGHLLGRLDLAVGNRFGLDLFCHNWIVVEFAFLWHLPVRPLGANNTLFQTGSPQPPHALATDSPMSTPPTKGTSLTDGH